MKKIMIGILVVIPIVILLTVDAVARFVTTNAWIAVESISFDFDDEEDKSIELTFGNEYYDLNDYLSVTIMPERATDKSFVWYIGHGKDELVAIDEEYDSKWKNGEVDAPAVMVDANGNPVDENDTGRIKINSYCYFYLYVQAEQYYDRCLVTVGGGDVKSIVIKGVDEMEAGDMVLFDTVFTPIDAMVDEVVWESDNPAVATVGTNGLVHAIGAGNAIIKATAVSRKDDEVPATATAIFVVTVIKGVSYFGEIVDIEASKNTINLGDVGISSQDIINSVGCAFDGEQVTIIDEVAAITTFEGTVMFRIVEDDGIEILGCDIFNFDENNKDSFILSVGKTISFSAVFKDKINHENAIISDIVWETSNPAVVSLKDGVFTGIKSGRAEITAKYYDGETLLSSASLTLAIEDKVTILILDVTNSSLEVGLAKETVLASKRYVDVVSGTTENNSFEIKFVRPTPTEGNEEVFYRAYNFVVKEVVDGEEFATDLAYFDDNKIYFNSEKIKGVVNFKVTVSAKYPLYSYLKQYTTQTFNLKVTEGIEVYDEASFKKAAANTTGSVVLAEDIAITNPKRERYLAYLNCDLYGNNHMIRSTVSEYIGRDSILLYVKADDVTISNAVIRVNEVGEEISSWEDENSQSLLGVGIRFQGEKSRLNHYDATTDTYEDKRINCRIEYSIVENCRQAINFYATVAQMQGCIIRNCLEVGVWVPTADYDNNGKIVFSHVTMTNNIFSNMCASAMSFQYSEYSDPAIDDKNEKNLQQCFLEGKNSKLVIKGFLDIYNWQELNCLNLLPRESVDEKYESLISAANASLIPKLREIDDLVNYRYLYNGVQYFHLGLIGTGALEPCYLEFECEDPRLNCIDTTQLNDDLLSKIPRIYVWVYDINADIIPTSSYRVNAKLIEHLHNQTA